MSALEQTTLAPVAFRVSDERLAARVSSDPTAFTELHERYDQALLRYTRSLLRDGHDAADATQEAWTRAFAALRDEPPLRVLSVRSWLFAIARNACIDRMRDGKRCSPAEIDERALGASPAADDVLELRTRAREALSDLAGLSERQRRAVVLRELNGLDGDELASALHTDTRRASWLLTDARRALAEVRSGRGLSCDATRHALESSRVRTRAVRAHIAGCPECDGFARRRVAARVHLHAIALFAAALPARLRALFAGGLDAARPAGAIAAATLVAGVPAIHVLHHRAGAQRPSPAAVAPARHRASAAPAVVLPVTPAARHRAPAHAAAEVRHVALVAPPAASRPGRAPDARNASPAPAAAVAALGSTAHPAPLLVPAAAPARRVVQRATALVTAVAPVAAPLLRSAGDLAARVTG